MRHPFRPAWSRRSWSRPLACAAVLALTACQTPPPPKKVVVAPPALPLPPPVAPPAPPLPPPPPLPPVHAQWSFRTGPVSCQAVAGAAGGSLTIAGGPALPIRLTMSGRQGERIPLNEGNPVTLFFTGAAGALALSATVQQGTATVSMPTTALALSDVLAILGGGVARLGNPHLGVPEVYIPPAGPAGRAWFICVRGNRLG